MARATAGAAQALKAAPRNRRRTARRKATLLDPVPLGLEGAGAKPIGRKRAEVGRRGAVGHQARQPAPDYRRHHEPVAGEAGRNPEARPERTDHWLEIRRVLVEPRPDGLDARVEQRWPPSLRD